MTTLAWARLPRGRAIELAAGLVALSPHEARLSARLAHPDAEPSGLGRPATEEEVARLQMRLRAVADERGWPRGLSRVDQSAVQQALTAVRKSVSFSRPRKLSNWPAKLDPKRSSTSADERTTHGEPLSSRSDCHAARSGPSTSGASNRSIKPSFIWSA